MPMIAKKKKKPAKRKVAKKRIVRKAAKKTTRKKAGRKTAGRKTAGRKTAGRKKAVKRKVRRAKKAAPARIRVGQPMLKAKAAASMKGLHALQGTPRPCPKAGERSADMRAALEQTLSRLFQYPHISALFRFRSGTGSR